MIHKLQKKFVFINMVLISIVLIVVFSTLFISNYTQIKNSTMDALQFELMGSFKDKRPPKFEIAKNSPGRIPNMIPVFLVFLGEDGSINDVIQNHNFTTSEDLIKEAVEDVIDGDLNEGLLRDLNLRYAISTESGVVKIAFADRTHEKNSMLNLVKNSFLVFIGAFIAFLLISLYLSKWALQPVKKAWDRQRQFVADASHELKTPLTVILANTNIVLSHQEETIQSQKKWIENTHTEAGRMKKLVDNLLFLARSDAEEQPVTMTELDFSDIVWNCLLPFESIAFEQQITIEEEIEPEVNLIGNAEQLKQLIVILLDNACKYTDKGGKINLSLKKSQGKVRITVHNTGTYIKEEDISQIFERFYRTSKSRARKEGGYGLGLSIAESIVKTHKGQINVSSIKEHGTTFIVDFFKS